MKRSEIFAWLQAHGGQRDAVKIDYEDVKNPKYVPGDRLNTEPPTKRQKLVTWTAADGRTLTVMDPETVDNPDQEMRPGGDVQGPGPVVDPEYESRGEGYAQKDPNAPTPQTPYEAAKSNKDLQEATANDLAGKGFYTNAQLQAQADDKANQSRAAEDQDIQRNNVTRQQDIDARAAEQQKEANRLAQARLDQEATNSGASNEVARGQLAVSQASEARQAAAANKPTFLSTADPANQNIAQYDPTTGQITATPNPNYDAVKAEADRVQKELTLGIQLNQYSAQEAKTKYDQWFAENVTVPFQAAQEERARAADQRAAMQAEEQRNQFGAQFGLDKAKFGQAAGDDAAKNEIALLPYRVGGNFGPDMSSAVNSLAAGGDVGGPSPSAGIHFSPTDFTYNKPNLAAIAQKATAAALAHLTDYKPTAGSFPSVSGGVPTPNFSSAPTSTPPIDLSSLTSQFGKFTGKYTPPAAAPPPPAPDPNQQPQP